MLSDTDRLENRLLAFFGELSDLNILHGSPDGAELNASKIHKIFDQMRLPIREAEDCAFSNPWAIAGLGSNEVRISAVLASLWDRKKYGLEAQAFLARFLQISDVGGPDEIDLSEGYRIQTEHCLNGSVKDRVDITVETRSAIIGIEVKVYASERDMQLPDYVAAIAKRARLMRRDQHLVVFLSPYKSRNSEHSAPSVSWRQLSECAALADDNTQSGWLIQQFGEFCRDLGS